LAFKTLFKNIGALTVVETYHEHIILSTFSARELDLRGRKKLYGLAHHSQRNELAGILGEILPPLQLWSSY
jgi:hypothetical protein